MKIFPSNRINRLIFVLCFGLSLAFYGTWILQETYIYITSIDRFELLALGKRGFYIRIFLDVWYSLPSRFSFAVPAAVFLIHAFFTYLGFAVLAPIAAWVSKGSR